MTASTTQNQNPCADGFRVPLVTTTARRESETSTVHSVSPELRFPSRLPAVAVVVTTRQTVGTNAVSNSGAWPVSGDAMKTATPALTSDPAAPNDRINGGAAAPVLRAPMALRATTIATQGNDLAAPPEAAPARPLPPPQAQLESPKALRCAKALKTLPFHPPSAVHAPQQAPAQAHLDRVPKQEVRHVLARTGPRTPEQPPVARHLAVLARATTAPGSTTEAHSS